MHAVARLALHPLITEHPDLVGEDGAATAPRPACEAGANDLGGTLMNESITRAAGAVHGQEMPPEAMEALIRSIGREPRQRTTLYRAAPATGCAASFGAAPLAPPDGAAGTWTATDNTTGSFSDLNISHSRM